MRVAITASFLCSSEVGRGRYGFFFLARMSSAVLGALTNLIYTMTKVGEDNHRCSAVATLIFFNLPTRSAIYRLPHMWPPLQSLVIFVTLGSVVPSDHTS